METNFTSEPWEQSLAQVRKVSPNPELFKRIQNAIPTHEKVSNLTVWLVAASLVALVAVNFLMLQHKTATATETKLTLVESNLNQSNQLYY
ncbi:MAG: hypothetical protein ACOVP9_08835 [Flavobacterium stagni]